MTPLTLRAQLNGLLYKAERQVVNSVLSQVQSQDHRDDLRLRLIAYAKFPQMRQTFTNSYLRILYEGLCPYVDMSRKKASDINYNLAMPCDLPEADDRD